MKWLICFLFPFALIAGEHAVDDDIFIVSPTTVLKGDQRIAGKTVEVSGRIEGDLYVMASQVYIDGVVTGDVICCCGLLDVQGEVKGDIRGICGQSVIGGIIGNNVSIASASFDLVSGSRIVGNLLLFTGSCDLLGKIGNNATVFASFLRMSGTVIGKLSAHVGSLRLTSSAFVGQNIDYYSNEVAVIDKGAKVGGSVNHHTSFFYSVSKNGLMKKLKVGSKIAASAMNFFFTLIIGLILIQFFRRKLDHAAEVIGARPIHSLFTGMVVIILLPLAALIFLISIVGAPFALGIIALNVLGFYSAKIVTLYYLGSHLFKRFSRFPKCYFMGMTIIYFILTFIPYFGWLMSGACMLLGLGAIVSRNLETSR